MWAGIAFGQPSRPRTRTSIRGPPIPSRNRVVCSSAPPVPRCPPWFHTSTPPQAVSASSSSPSSIESGKSTSSSSRPSSRSMFIPILPSRSSSTSSRSPSSSSSSPSSSSISSSRSSSSSPSMPSSMSSSSSPSIKLDGCSISDENRSDWDPLGEKEWLRIRSEPDDSEPEPSSPEDELS